MFVKYSCGCIGIPNGKDKAIIVKACDDEYNGEYSMFERIIQEKKFEIIHTIREEKIVKELGKLISDGYALREVKNILQRK